MISEYPGHAHYGLQSVKIITLFKACSSRRAAVAAPFSPRATKEEVS